MRTSLCFTHPVIVSHNPQMRPLGHPAIVAGSSGAPRRLDVFLQHLFGDSVTRRLFVCDIYVAEQCHPTSQASGRSDHDAENRPRGGRRLAGSPSPTSLRHVRSRRDVVVGPRLGLYLPSNRWSVLSVLRPIQPDPRTYDRLLMRREGDYRGWDHCAHYRQE
jgi:hypothetical protein